jgi:hypothetical protein
MKRAGASLLLGAALVLAACTPVASRPIQIEAPAGDIGAIPTTITDTTGMVATAGFGLFAVDGVVVNPPGRPDAVHLEWLGGMCDKRFDLTVARAGDAVQVTLATTVDAQGGCRAAGIERGLDLVFGGPVPADTVRFIVDGREQERDG